MEQMRLHDRVSIDKLLKRNYIPESLLSEAIHQLNLFRT